MFGWLAGLFKTPPPPQSAAGPAAPERLRIDLAAISGAIADADGLPHPRWELIAHELQRRFPGADPELLWTSAAAEWLEILRGALDGAFRVHESANFLYLTKKSTVSQRHLARSAE